MDTDKITLDDVVISTTLGTGTFGRVRLIKLKNDKTGRPQALKMLKKTEILRLKQVEHIRAEKNILENISHPFIIKLYQTFQDDKQVQMILEFSPGGELFNRLRKEGRFANDVALFQATEIVTAFCQLHEKNIAYRDLKPENLLIDLEGHIKITDFGFAKIVDDRTFTLCGTPEQLAPEIIQSKGHGKGVDWWAFGILVYEMIAGYPPFQDENPFGIQQKILAGKIEFSRNIDSKCKDLIKRLLNADKTKRLGCMKGGPEEVKKHKWFRGVDWQGVLRREIPPPWIPEMKNAEDTNNFDKYPESMEEPKAPTAQQQKDAFIGF